MPLWTPRERDDDEVNVSEKIGKKGDAEKKERKPRKERDPNAPPRKAPERSPLFKATSAAAKAHRRWSDAVEKIADLEVELTSAKSVRDEALKELMAERGKLEALMPSAPSDGAVHAPGGPVRYPEA